MGRRTRRSSGLLVAWLEPLLLEARVELGRRLVEGGLVVVDQLVVLHRRILEDLEGLAGRAQPGGLQPVGVAAGAVLAVQGGAVLAVGGPLHPLGERPLGPLAGGLLVDGQLGERERLQPLVGDGPAAHDRAAVGAGGEARLGPLQRLEAVAELAGDRLVGLLADPPVGLVDQVLGALRGAGDALAVGGDRGPQPLQPPTLLLQQGARLSLVHAGNILPSVERPPSRAHTSYAPGGRLPGAEDGNSHAIAARLLST